MSLAFKDWGLTDHVCLACLGRILVRDAAPDLKEFRCSNCGATGTGVVKSICACGSKIGARAAGIRCVVNKQRTPELLSEIIAKEVR